MRPVIYSLAYAVNHLHDARQPPVEVFLCRCDATPAASQRRRVRVSRSQRKGADAPKFHRKGSPMKKSFLVHTSIVAFTVGLSVASSSARADTYATYDVNATYDSTGAITGSFTLDTTSNTSDLVDLIIVGVGGVNSGAYTDPTQFGTGAYNTADGVMATYNTEDPGLQIFLTYPAGGGTLYSGGFGSSSVDSYFSPTCGGEICGYDLNGTVTLATGPISAAPEPATWALMTLGIGGIGLMLRRVRQTMGCRFNNVFAA